jgi:hypothetical protein
LFFFLILNISFGEKKLTEKNQRSEKLFMAVGLFKKRRKNAKSDFIKRFFKIFTISFREKTPDIRKNCMLLKNVYGNLFLQKLKKKKQKI